MPYYRIGYATNFCGVNEDKIVHTDEELTEDLVQEWAIEEVGVSSLFEELDKENIDEEDLEFVEEW